MVIHHDKGNLQKKVCWRLRFQRARVHDHHGREYDSRQAGRCSSGAIAESLHANPQAWGREMDGDGGRAWNPSCTPPPTRPGFLILPRLFHQPVIEDSNIPISLWGPFSFNHYTNKGDQPKKETVFRSLGRLIFIFEGKLSIPVNRWKGGQYKR